MSDEPTAQDCRTPVERSLWRELQNARKERDEARREVCWLLAEAEGGTQEEHAADQGWACFDQDENGTMNAP